MKQIKVPYYWNTMNRKKTMGIKSSFVWVPWLLARLWVSFDPSRLIMSYLRPKPAIERIAKSILRLEPASWVMSGKELYCLKISEKTRTFIIERLPTINSN